MNDNVQLSHTQLGAVTKVKCGAFAISKPYATMEAAVCEAVELGLISLLQKAMLEGNCTGKPAGLSTFAPGLVATSLFDSGFRICAH